MAKKKNPIKRDQSGDSTADTLFLVVVFAGLVIIFGNDAAVAWLIDFGVDVLQGSARANGY